MQRLQFFHRPAWVYWKMERGLLTGIESMPASMGNHGTIVGTELRSRIKGLAALVGQLFGDGLAESLVGTDPTG